MTYRILWSPDALNDLDDIWRDVWEASRDLDTADRYIAGLRNAVSTKKDYPNSGSPLNFLGVFTGIRYVHYKRYLAFYRVRNDAMEIGRILFDGSDYMNKLFGFIAGESEP